MIPRRPSAHPPPWFPPEADRGKPACAHVTCVDRNDSWEGYRESRICSRDTYPESYITEHTSIRRLTRPPPVEHVTSDGASQISTGASKSLHWARPICIINRDSVDPLSAFGFRISGFEMMGVKEVYGCIKLHIWCKL